MSLELLEDDALGHICSYLTFQEVKSVSLICKSLRDIARYAYSGSLRLVSKRESFSSHFPLLRKLSIEELSKSLVGNLHLLNNLEELNFARILPLQQWWGLSATSDITPITSVIQISSSEDRVEYGVLLECFPRLQTLILGTPQYFVCDSAPASLTSLCFGAGVSDKPERVAATKKLLSGLPNLTFLYLGNVNTSLTTFLKSEECPFSLSFLDFLPTVDYQHRHPHLSGLNTIMHVEALSRTPITRLRPRLTLSSHVNLDTYFISSHGQQYAPQIQLLFIRCEGLRDVHSLALLVLQYCVNLQSLTVQYGTSDVSHLPIVSDHESSSLRHTALRKLCIYSDKTAPAVDISPILNAAPCLTTLSICLDVLCGTDVHSLISVQELHLYMCASSTDVCWNNLYRMHNLKRLSLYDNNEPKYDFRFSPSDDTSPRVYCSLENFIPLAPQLERVDLRCEYFDCLLPFLRQCLRLSVIEYNTFSREFVRRWRAGLSQGRYVREVAISHRYGHMYEGSIAD